MRLARQTRADESQIEQTRVQLEQLRDLLRRYMASPVATDNGDRLLPCPYCAVIGDHVASCRLSQMETGQVLEIVARPR